MKFASLNQTTYAVKIIPPDYLLTKISHTYTNFTEVGDYLFLKIEFSIFYVAFIMGQTRPERRRGQSE